LQIAITQPIRLDDVVIIEGEWGRIEEIALTYVVVRIWDQRRLIVPSTYFFEKPFQNWTRTTSEILGTVFIYTDYHVSFEALREELTRLLKSTPLWDGKVNVLQVTDAKERSIEIRALMSAKDSGTAWDLRVFIREKLIEFLQKNYPESLPKTRVLVENYPEKIKK
jgi:small-conductance mechanosensitive channel